MTEELIELRKRVARCEERLAEIDHDILRLDGKPLHMLRCDAKVQTLRYAAKVLADECGISVDELSERVGRGEGGPQFETVLREMRGT